jgi:putative transposase
MSRSCVGGTGVTDAAFYTWRSKYGGLEISEMRRLRQLEEENRRLNLVRSGDALFEGGNRGG